MASAVEQLVNGYETSAPVDFRDYYNAYGRDNFNKYGTWTDHNPYGFGGTISNFFTGDRKTAQSAYENYLSEYEFRRQQKENAEKNAQTWAREDSQIQRLMKDYTASGLNPYLLLNSGNISGGVVSSQPYRAEYQRKKEEKERQNEGKALASALKVLLFLLLK